jgi:hypothetical protein
MMIPRRRARSSSVKLPSGLRQSVSLSSAPDIPVALRGGGGFQPRRQRFASERLTRPQVVGFVDASAGFAAADPQSISQRVRQLAAQLGLAGLAGQSIDQRMTGGRQPPRLGFKTLQQCQAFGRGQRIGRHFEHVRHRTVQRLEPYDDVLSATRMHVRMIIADDDWIVPQNAYLWITATLWIGVRR